MNPVQILMMNQQKSKVGELGLLYNMYAVLDSRNIAPAGCHIPTWEEINTLITYIGGFKVGGGKLKEVGAIHWDSPNTGATDEYLFTGVGNGQRSSEDGTFVEIKQSGIHWSTTLYWQTYYRTLLLRYNSREINDVVGCDKHSGCAIRCICDTNDTIITDIDGNVYDVITIGTQKWLSKNLKVKKYRNGDSIINVTDNTLWIGLEIGAWCYYDNNPDNF